MYKIDSKVDKPNIKYFRDKVESNMSKGVKITRDIYKIEHESSQYLDSIRRYICSTYRIENPNSTQQVSRYMESLKDADVYEVAYIDGKWKTDKSVLKVLSDRYGFNFASDMLEYRKVKKLNETYKSLIKEMDINNLIRPEVSYGKTNRVNYSRPALMNIDKDILWDIVVPRKVGNVLYSVDIKNQEPFIMVHLLGIEKLRDKLVSPDGLYESIFKEVYEPKVVCNIFVSDTAKDEVWDNDEMYRNPKVPAEYYTPIKVKARNMVVKLDTGIVGELSLIGIMNIGKNSNSDLKLPDKVKVKTYGGEIGQVEVEWEEVPNTLENGIHRVYGKIKGLDIRCEGKAREQFKTAWNAMNYGSGYKGIEDMCGEIEPKAVWDYFHNIKEIKEYQSLCKKAANQGIQKAYTLFRTEMYANESGSRLRRILMDLPIQGLGADILALLYKRFYDVIEKESLVGKLDIYFSRHDELVIEVDGNWEMEVTKEYVSDLLYAIFEHQIDDWEPFRLEVRRIDEVGSKFEIGVSVEVFQ